MTKNYLILSLFLLSGSLAVCASDASVAPTTHLEEIKNQHVSSFPVPPAKAERPESEKTWWEKATRMDKPTFAPTPFAPYYDTLRAYLVLSPLLKVETSVLSHRTLKDLDFFVGSTKKSNNLLQFINRTHTKEGEVYLATLLAQPLTDIQELKNRQTIIRAFTENDELRSCCNALFTTLAEQHDAFMMFWSQEQPANQLFTNNEYWSTKYLLPLNTSTLYQHPIAVVNTVMLAFFACLPVFVAKSYYTMYNDHTTITLTRLTLTAEGTIFGPLMTYLSVTDTIPNKIKLTKYLHEKSIAIATVVRTVDALQELISQCPDLATVHHKELFSQFAVTKASLSSKMKKMLSLAHTSTFEGKPTIAALHGRIRVIHALIEQVKSEFLPVLVALAEVDAYLSCANLYKEHQEGANVYSFATYLQQDTPSLTIQNMWNPFVGAQKSIANSVELGGKLPQNIILTGPNAGGKSTFSKGVTITTLLAQTVGIVPAQACTLTPFTKINTYMNISDDTAGGNSLFKTEVMRAQELLNTILTLPKTEFSLSVMDEMFSGTSPKEGEAASYAVAKNIGSHPHSLAIIATHFPLLKELETETPHFKNYQVRVVHHENGTFSYPFKLEEGAADQNVAISILQNEGFESSILADAHAILNRNKAATA